MKISVKKVDALRREMHFEIPKDRVTKKMDEVLAEIVKHAKIPGFRPGKAPRNMVESAHGKTAREEMLKNLIPEVYQEGIKQENLDPIDFPAIDQVELVETGLKFRASFDIRPEVKIKDYKGIVVAKKSTEISEEELAKTLEFFKKGRGMEENAVLDDAFAKSMGFATLEEFKNALKRNMESDKDRQNHLDAENEIVDALVKLSDFHAPQSLVDRQIEGRLEEFKRRLSQYGAKGDDIEKKIEESKAQIKEAAEKDVKTYLILHKIAEIEKIEAAKDENLAMKVMEFLFKEAKWEEKK